jgi:hypothetical protein
MRYFKIFRRGRGFADIISANSLDEAYDMAVAEYGWSFKIIECDLQEWLER